MTLIAGPMRSAGDQPGAAGEHVRSMRSSDFQRVRIGRRPRSTSKPERRQDMRKAVAILARADYADACDSIVVPQ